jgi:SnoaL-like domain
MQPIEDRLAIEDLFLEYARAMDFGEIDAVAALFTPDGRVRDIAGKLWDAAAGGPRGFAAHWLVPPGARRGQHWIQRVRTERISDDAYRILSYWSSTRWEVGSPAPVLGALGLYTDTVVRRDGRWMIQEKVIDRWETTGIDARRRKE